MKKFTVLLLLVIGFLSRAQMRHIPHVQDPVFIGASLNYSYSDVALSYSVFGSLPLVDELNIGFNYNMTPRLSNLKFLKEITYDTYGQVKLFRPNSYQTLYLFGGYNFSQWESSFQIIGDDVTKKWNKAESFLVGAHYQIELGTYSFLTIEHKYYIDYKSQYTSIGWKFPIYYDKSDKEGRGYTHGTAMSGRKFQKNRTRGRGGFGKRKHKLRLSSPKGNH